MPDSRKHRGAHPEDRELFCPARWPALRSAVADLSWLLSREYAARGALQLVGNRYSLEERQRLAVMRSSCSDAQRSLRQTTRMRGEQLRGMPIWLDGFNVLTTIEAALSQGVLLLGRDGCLRDMASMHGSYRKVAETLPALRAIGHVLHDELHSASAHWLLDRPVSNSGRLRAVLLQIAEQQSWEWEVDLVDSPDRVLQDRSEIVATADAVILDRSARWYNLAARVVRSTVADPWVVPLGESE